MIATRTTLTKGNIEMLLNATNTLCLFQMVTKTQVEKTNSSCKHSAGNFSYFTVPYCCAYFRWPVRRIAANIPPYRVIVNFARGFYIGKEYNDSMGNDSLASVKARALLELWTEKRPSARAHISLRVPSLVLV